MSSYLDPLKPLLPSGLGLGEGCPLLWAQAYPYVRTLALGGWFGWVPRDRDPERRENDLAKLGSSRPNSSFVNEVLVRCPNSEAEVLVGIGPGTASRVVLRVIRITGHCAHGHHAGQTIGVSAAQLASAIGFVHSFPGLLEKAFAPTQEAFSPCVLRKAEPMIETRALDGPCRYHLGTETYRDEQGWTGGLCPAAFHSAYPHALAMYYGERDSDQMEIACPAGASPVRISLQLTPRLPRPMPAAARFAAKVAGRLLHPVDPLLRLLEFRIETANGCPRGHAPGEIYSFNLGRRDVLCPASAYSIYPYARLSAAARKGFLELGGWSECVCPDFLGATYGLESEEQNEDDRVD